MTLGQTLQELRCEAGLSRQTLAKTLHVSLRTLSKWESDDAFPNSRHLLAISQVFEISIGSLLSIAGMEAPSRPEDTPINAWQISDIQAHQGARRKKIPGTGALYCCIAVVLILLLIFLLGLQTR
jgi:transcriptional regulator with XRE-family HTH domain